MRFSETDPETRPETASLYGHTPNRGHMKAYETAYLTFRHRRVFSPPPGVKVVPDTNLVAANTCGQGKTPSDTSARQNSNYPYTQPTTTNPHNRSGTYGPTNTKTKKPSAMRTASVSEDENLQRIHVELDAALEVSCFVLMNDIHFGKLIEHSGHFRKKNQSGVFVRRVTQSLHRVTRRFVVISVVRIFNGGLAYSFFR